jgi:hypothetical protein
MSPPRHIGQPERREHEGGVEEHGEADAHELAQL